ncbi:MAG: hypothetical protein ACK6A7_15935 [Planctomycetota bacterium]|jgi:uncharacterized protein YeeX (DUF496 family)
MGVDISSCSGVPVTAKLLANIVNEDNKELASRTLLRYTARLLKTLKNDINDEELDECDRRSKQAVAKLMVSCFETLTTDSSVEDIREMLVKMAPGVEDGFDSHVANSEEAVEIWGELIRVLYPGAPQPEGTLFIGSPRYQDGWDLPIKKVLFVFSEDACFKRVKTPAGKQLDFMLGKKTKLKSWTEYSV